MATDTITSSITEHLSVLAQLTLSEEEAKSITSQLEETIKYVHNLAELDTKNVEPTSHTTDSHNVFFEDGEESINTLTHEDAMVNAPNAKKDSFVVPRIM